MSNIYPIGQTRQYLLSRAARNRRGGKYDQAMKLLSRAEREYPSDAEIQAEIAATYDEMGSEEAAIRAYLRVVRLGGKQRSSALFKLAVTSAQHGDVLRAQSYFDAFCAGDRSGVSAELAELLGRQLSDAAQTPHMRTRRARARQHEKRAVQQLHAGRLHACKRNVARAIALNETPQRRLLKACCHLVLEEGNAAIQEAQRALLLRAVYVQALCVLIDAYTLLGRKEDAKRTLVKAVRQACSTDSLLSVAVESAKHGYDRITLILTRRILKREPWNIRAMAMRACAMMNMGTFGPAKRLFGQLASVMPEHGIFDAYYALAGEGEPCGEHLTMAQDVTQDEAMHRSLHILSVLQEEPSKIRNDHDALSRLCQNASWAIYSPLAGANITLIAIVVLSALDTEQTRAVLFDALISPQLDDGTKSSILQAISEHCSEQPTHADLGGRFVRIAAGASIPQRFAARASQAVVQRAADRLASRYPDAPERLLAMWIACLQSYGPVRGRNAGACSAALEYAYHHQNQRSISLAPVARRYDVSVRLVRVWIRRILRSLRLQHTNFDESWRIQNEVHQF